MKNAIKALLIACTLSSSAFAQKEWSGVYPHLTMRNSEGECGTGAVVVWQGSLWAITYAPHRPNGSSDKLYEVTPLLEQKIFEGSVGGTPANRMIHKETNQLLIGPYLINAEKKIRVLPPSQMFGRLTGNARHLSDPFNKVYYATMEEGLYEVDLNSLKVLCLIRDGNSGAPETGIQSQLPGYHGKGLYSGQGVLVYANNGDRDPRVKVDPTIPSGALATWNGKGDWQLVRRNQFTEVTGPGGIYGSEKPETDPIWSMGWDARSVILAVLEEGQWHYYRLPKGSHSYDGAHGWNTEWPRIREVGENNLLATMHGTFWNFPTDFSKHNSHGISPRSNYLKVIGDFCRWNENIVFGCDDSAASEFLNTRSFKAAHGSPGQSNSNLWFVPPDQLDQLGPSIGRGAVWLKDTVTANEPSDAYLFAGYDLRHLSLTHDNQTAVTFELEVDQLGNNQWKTLKEITVPAGKAIHHSFAANETGAWIRLKSSVSAKEVTAFFQYRNRDKRTDRQSELFAGIATFAERRSPETHQNYGLMKSLAFDRLGLVASNTPAGAEASYYELTPSMKLQPATGLSPAEFVPSVSQPLTGISVDDASVIISEDGKRYRLPKNDSFQLEPVEETKGPKLEDFLQEHLAIDAAVKVSSQHDSYAAAHAVDGKLGDESRWIGKNEDGVWIELDFKTAKQIQSLWIVSGWKESGTYVAKNFDIQIKRDGSWQSVPGGHIRNNSAVQKEIVFDQPLTTQHLRIFSETADFFRIYEIAPFPTKLNIQRNLSGYGTSRICREVATERDLLNLHGTFYELPARNAQGISKVRPIATHNLAIHDFCSHNGLLLFTGIDSHTDSHHIIRSEDGKAALWAGVVDDLWKLGKPRGTGGPWFNTPVEANQPSDPYLMTAYDRKKVSMSSTQNVTLHIEVDLDGTGLWVPYESFNLQAGATIEHEFPEEFSAYWVRSTCDRATVATVMFTYD